MVNTVFGGATTQIVYKQVYLNDDTNTTNTSTGSNVNPQSQALSINKFIQEFIDLLNMVYLGKSKEFTDFDRLLKIIMKYLYDSFVTDNSATYSILKNNVIKVFKALLLEMEYIVFKNGDLYFLEGTIIASLLPFLTNFTQGENENADLLELVKFQIEKFLDKLEDDDIDPSDDFKRKIIQFDKLKQMVLNSLETYLTLFKNGNFTTLEEQFTEIEQNDIGKKIISDSLYVITEQELEDYMDTNQLFKQYRSFIFKIIDGLNSAILLDNKNRGLTVQNQTLQGFSDILSDPTLLQDYIDRTYGDGNINSALLSETLTLTTGLELKPEYKEYVELYGFPESGVYDAEKLQEIIQSLEG